MTLLGNFDSMSGQEGNDPCLWNKRSERSMRDQNQCAHQRGSGARSTPHAAYTPPRVSFFFLFSCPYKISQQSHLSRPTAIYRPSRAIRSPDEHVKKHKCARASTAAVHRDL